MSYRDLQDEVYFKGLTVPSLPMANHELEQRAESAMAPSTLSYVVFAELDLIVAVDGYPTLDDLNRKSRTSSLS